MSAHPYYIPHRFHMFLTHMFRHPGDTQVVPWNAIRSQSLRIEAYLALMGQ